MRPVRLSMRMPAGSSSKPCSWRSSSVRTQELLPVSPGHSMEEERLQNRLSRWWAGMVGSANSALSIFAACRRVRPILSMGMSTSRPVKTSHSSFGTFGRNEIAPSPSTSFISLSRAGL